MLRMMKIAKMDKVVYSGLLKSIALQIGLNHCKASEVPGVSNESWMALATLQVLALAKWGKT